MLWAVARHQNHSRDRGFTLIELLVVMTLVVVLVLTAMENLLPLTGEAERVAVERNRVAIDTSLRHAAAERLLSQGRDGVRALEGQNPVSLLERPPSNYLGEKPGATPDIVPPGHWYWDPEGEWLIYRVRHGRYFDSDSGDPPHIRYRLVREGGERFFTLRLESAHSYRWDTDGSELARWILAGDAGR
ncbi:prepilin-type N-terminal cleavage/methylation domain-containing protein [Gammaproteobacteria bacterium AB-CW1]|uniref:Prepilin-type N-terminal cleavage/methylation domain-containing protein n=1 Tax=Natronospira elongata TaxID=3110268 RepID=A0AAP6JDK3_9GAMM|nr:prepilin-type N-terminal cleavage/methylation domain-containing protein [Gammaproteobacteria bacterium AB-CW1]